MQTIHLITLIDAPIHLCFDLARSIDLHVDSMRRFNERAVDGKKNGLISIHESVTWQAKHFGLNFKMTSLISVMDSPTVFVDEMIQGPFKKLYHQHLFKNIGTCTEMTDIFEFEAPFGILGRLAEKVFLKKYMLKLLLERNVLIKGKGEEQWREILHNKHSSTSILS